MATTSTDVYWSKDYAIPAWGVSPDQKLSDMVDFTTAGPFRFFIPADPPHELDVINRLSEAYRNLTK